MSTTSIVLYIVPAVIVLAGLRRQGPVALTLVAVTLIAVGVTMYDSGPLNVHLVAITVAALSLAITTAPLVLRPKRTGDRAAPGHAATGR